MSPGWKRALPAAGLGGLLAAGCLGGCAGVPRSKAAPMPRVDPGLAAASRAPSSREVMAEARIHLDRDNIPGALHALNSLPRALRVPAIRELHAGLAQDPWRAARFALALPRSEWRDAALEQAAGALVDGDAEAAIQWVIALPDPAMRFEAGQAVTKRLLERGPPAAVARLMNLPAQAARDDLVRLLAAGWTRHDAPNAVAWARDLPAGELKSSVLTSVAFALAQTSPAQARELVEGLPDGVGRRRVLAAIGQTWAARDAEAAWAWARGLPAGESRDAATAGIETGLGMRTSAWSLSAGAFGSGVLSAPLTGELARHQRDPVSMPFGWERERELRRKFEELLLLSPTMAANWVSTLPIPDRKEEMVDRVAREWLVSNPAMAESWMDQNMVPPERREQLLRDVGLWRPALPPER